MKEDNENKETLNIGINFPANTRKDREERKYEKAEEKKEDVKKVEKVISGTVITRKKSAGKRFMESIIGDDAGSVGGYLLHDVLIPALKDTIADMVKGGIEMVLFGEKKGSRTSRDRGKSYVSYDRVSSRESRDRDRRDNYSRNRASHNFDDIILSSRGDAEQVLSDLVDLIYDYKQATVADLYDMVGITSSFTDAKYGWTDLRNASVSRARDGYLLNLPRTVVLD